MLQSLLSLDTELLIWARGLLGPDSARIVQILGESVVLWWGLLLTWLWLTWVKHADNRWKIASLQIFTTIILTFLFYTIVNFGIPAWRPNPQEVVWGLAPLIPHPLDNSFPSGHALFTAAFIVGLIRFSPKRWLILITIMLGLITALARVIGWVHYPGDIIGGWILGGFWAYGVSLMIDRWFLREYIFAPFVKFASFLRL